MFSSKLLTSGIDYYASGFGSDRHKKGQKINAKTNLRLFSNEIAYILNKKREPRALDVGAGYGFFVNHLYNLGFLAEGVEVSRQEVQFAQDCSRGTMHLGTLDTVSLNHSKYDLITCFEVIEHIAEPLPFLELIHSLLAEDGFLTVVTDNFGADCLRAFGPEFPKWIPHSHVTHFDPSSFLRVFAEVGMDVTKMISFTPWTLAVRSAFKRLFCRAEKSPEQAFNLEETLSNEMCQAYKLFHFRQMFDPVLARITARNNGRGAMLCGVVRKRKD